MVGYLKDLNNIFKQDLKETLEDTLQEPTKEEAIDYYNRFVGRVVNNNDPDHLGMCQIRVLGLFGTEIPDKDLPWFLPEFPPTGSKRGSFLVPEVGDIITCYFHKGDLYQGFYFATMVDINSQPTRRMRNYPQNSVFWEMDDGSYFEYDRKEKVLNINHASGTQITIATDGSVKINCAGKNFSVDGAKNCEINGAESVNLGGNMKVLFSTTGTPPTDAEGRPLLGVGVSDIVTVGGNI